MQQSFTEETNFFSTETFWSVFW